MVAGGQCRRAREYDVEGKVNLGALGFPYFISFLDLWAPESNEAVTSLSLTQTCRHRCATEDSEMGHAILQSKSLYLRED